MAHDAGMASLAIVHSLLAPIYPSLQTEKQSRSYRFLTGSYTHAFYIQDRLSNDTVIDKFARAHSRYVISIPASRFIFNDFFMNLISFWIVQTTGIKVLLGYIAGTDVS